jgi:hypothetical protein
MSLLPTVKTEIQSQDPKNLIIFGLPKVGKTTALAELPNNLIIDLENGSAFVSGYIAKAESYIDLYNLAKELKTSEHPFQFVTIDTVTALEEIALPLAKKLYMDTPMGANFTGDNVLKLPQGAGHAYLREAIQKIIGWFQASVKNVILVGHTKDKSISEGGTELNVKALDLSGKTSNILSAKSDAICYVYRDPDNGNLMANFGDMNSVLTGARMPHLAGKTILLAEREQTKEGDWHIKTYWENIFPSLR